MSDKLDEMLNEILQKESKSRLEKLVYGYHLSALSEGKSAKTVSIVEASVRYLGEFLLGHGLSTDVAEIGASELRQFGVSLRERPRFAHHRFTKPQGGNLSGHTINGYMRALQAFWSWLEREEFISENPFRKVKVPKAPKKVIPTFTEEQLQQIFEGMDVASPTGYRDYTIMLILLDTGIRCSELTGLRLTDVNLDSRLLKVWGKGSKERVVPIGAKVQKAIWKYISRCRPEPALPRYGQVFLTHDGHPLTKGRLEAIVEHHGKKAGVTGVRVSPHTFRHTMAVTFLRNGGDVFSLQRIMGHSNLEVLRGYVNLAQSDIMKGHQRNSPADNLDFAFGKGSRRNYQKSSKPSAGRSRAAKSSSGTTNCGTSK